MLAKLITLYQDIVDYRLELACRLKYLGLIEVVKAAAAVIRKSERRRNQLIEMGVVLNDKGVMRKSNLPIMGTPEGIPAKQGLIHSDK